MMRLIINVIALLIVSVSLSEASSFSNAKVDLNIMDLFSKSKIFELKEVDNGISIKDLRQIVADKLSEPSRQVFMMSKGKQTMLDLDHLDHFTLEDDEILVLVVKAPCVHLNIIDKVTKKILYENNFYADAIISALKKSIINVIVVHSGKVVHLYSKDKEMDDSKLIEDYTDINVENDILVEFKGK